MLALGVVACVLALVHLWRAASAQQAEVAAGVRAGLLSAGTSDRERAQLPTSLPELAAAQPRSPEQAPPPTSEPTLIRVVREADDTPIAAAAVHVVWLNDELDGMTDAAGELTVPVRGVLGVEVRADGFLPWSQVLLGSDQLTVPLSRGGTVELSIVGGNGWSGLLDVCLLPPIADGREWNEHNWLSSLELLLEHPTQLPHAWCPAAVSGCLQPKILPRTAAPGELVRWEGLPSGRPWRIAINGGPPVLFDPAPLEHSPFKPNGSISHSDPLPPMLGARISGNLEIKDEETTYITMSALPHGSVTGRLDGTLNGRASTVQVQLFHVDKWLNPYDGPDYSVPYLEAKHVRNSSEDGMEGGIFHFPAVLPGPKLIKLEWSDTDGAAGIARTTCRVPAGEDADIGTLGGEWQTELQLDVFCVDESGERIPAEEVFLPTPDSAGSPPAYLAHISGPPIGADNIGSWSASLPVSVGVPAALKGLALGDYSLHLRSVAARHRPLWVLSGNPEPVEFAMSGVTQIELPILVRRANERTLMVELPPRVADLEAESSPYLMGKLCRSGSEDAIGLNTNMFQRGAPLRMNMISGTWRAWAGFSRWTSGLESLPEEALADPGYCIDPTPFVVETGTSATQILRAIPAAGLDLLLLDAAGTPLPDRRECLRPAAAPQAGCGTWSATSDEAGILRFRGLPPHTDWELSVRGQPPVRSGAAGSISSVQASCAARRGG
ncbi:MAG: hypothetical protein CMJ87_00080 [Planctomycetes bacterium]|nr:hypothetical protein [Planctomycetota bacterium]